MNYELEHNLIKHLSQINPPEFAVNALLKDDLDWRYIQATAEDHRIIPIIFKNIRTFFSNQVSKDIYQKFQKRSQEIATYNFARSTQLIKLVKLLQKHNFPVLSYKGMMLAELAYKDVTLRQFTDIDLLIKKEDFYKIKKLLQTIDCRPAWELSEKQEKAVLKHYYEYPFFFGTVNTLVEVHWGFIESFFAFDFETDKIWDRTQSIAIYDNSIATLSPADYLIVLSSHGSKHFWKRLSWICDIDRLISNIKIDWDIVMERAIETGSLRMLLLALYLSKECLNTDIPANILAKINDVQNVAMLGDMFIKDLFKTNSEPEDWKEMAKIHLLMREKAMTKFKYSKRLLTTKLIDKLFLPMGRPQ